MTLLRSRILGGRDERTVMLIAIWPMCILVSYFRCNSNVELRLVLGRAGSLTVPVKSTCTFYQVTHTASQNSEMKVKFFTLSSIGCAA
jgi:hypothetical protein